MLLPSPEHLRPSIVLFLGLLGLGVGYCGGGMVSTGGGAIGLCYFLMMAMRTRARMLPRHRGAPVVREATSPVARPPAERPVSEDPVQRLIDQSRYVILLMRQVVEKLSEEQFQRGLEAFQQGMALVPGGHVEVKKGTGVILDDSDEEAADVPQPGCLIPVEPFFLDRCPVTNRQYWEFIAAGGYREIALWDKHIWPAVLDMVDQTGQPGPRFWKNGCYLPGEEDLPVVGIGWHEAAACARWMCKRLPTDAEWIKAASWPVPIDAETLAQRRYPWGDSMDRTRANVWGAASNRIVAVHEYPEGVNVGGVYQMIGNVWEWLDGDFEDKSGNGKLELPTPMKSIRGGGYDTYFESQANTQFQSGENPLNRRHNIGFRCAIPMRDLVLSWPGSDAPAADPDTPADEHKETVT